MFVNQIEDDLYLLIGATYHSNCTAFVSKDEVLLVHEIVLEWPRPGSNRKLTSKTDEPIANPQEYDLILRWDAPSRHFVTLFQICC